MLCSDLLYCSVCMRMRMRMPTRTLAQQHLLYTATQAYIVMMKCYFFSKNSCLYAAHFDTTPPNTHTHELVLLCGLSFRLAFFCCFPSASLVFFGFSFVFFYFFWCVKPNCHRHVPPVLPNLPPWPVPRVVCLTFECCTVATKATLLN